MIHDKEMLQKRLLNTKKFIKNELFSKYCRVCEYASMNSK